MSLAKMHFVIDAHLVVKKIDGVSRYLIGLLRELPKIDRSVQYTILSLPKEKTGLPAEIFANSNVKRVELKLNGPTPRQHFIIPSLLKKLNADLYHHPQYDLPQGLRLPSVVTIHDLKYLHNPEYLAKGSRLKSWYIRQSLHYSVKKAAHVIAVSESTQRDLQKEFSMQQNKISVIHHGFDFKTTKAGNSSGLKIPGDFILFVGTRRPHKNIEGLIRAVHVLKTEMNTAVSLVIAGKSYSDYREPEYLSKKLGLDEQTHFLDFVPDEQLSWLYKHARILALPSFYEGFGLPLLEAMAHGTPVVGSDVSSIPEVIGDAGLLVNPKSPEDIAAKLHQILIDNSLVKNLSKMGTERARQFSWANVAKLTFDCYIQCLQK